MSNWEQCRNYGLVQIEPNNTIRLYYNQLEMMLSLVEDNIIMSKR